MSWGLRWPSPSASTLTTCQVEGMNCIAPTARSIDRVLVELATVGVLDRGGAVLAVQLDAVDAGLGDAVLGQRVPAVAAVVGLDPADRGDQLPGDVAGLVGGVDDLRTALVGRQRRGRDAVGGGTGDHRVRRTLGDRGSDHTGHRHTGRRLDRIGRHLGAVRQAPRCRPSCRKPWHWRSRGWPSTPPTGVLAEPRRLPCCAETMACCSCLDSLPWVTRCRRSPNRSDTSINDPSQRRSRTNVSCDPHHTGR